MFKVLMLTEQNGETSAQVQSVKESDLPSGNVTVAVEYSSLNYKDALAITGKGRIVKSFPMVPGIDAAGSVTHSDDLRYKRGDKVVITGYGIGEKRWGGMAELINVEAGYLITRPDNLTSKQSMQIGTAGLTAMLSIIALEESGITPDIGEILVTGASGGVGSVAISLLHALGYSVTAVTGRIENTAYLKRLGSNNIISREEMLTENSVLDSQQWASVIDSVGGHILAKALSQTKYAGVVTACGLAADIKLSTSVMPFILRSVKLIGIDSVYCSHTKRVKAWQRLSDLLSNSFFEQVCNEIKLEQITEYAGRLIKNKLTGRFVVNVKTN